MFRKGYRTVGANLLLGLPVLAFILVSPEVRALIPEAYLPYFTLGVLIVNLWLRSRTDTALGKSE